MEPPLKTLWIDLSADDESLQNTIAIGISLFIATLQLFLCYSLVFSEFLVIDIWK